MEASSVFKSGLSHPPHSRGMASRQVSNRHLLLKVRRVKESTSLLNYVEQRVHPAENDLEASNYSPSNALITASKAATSNPISGALSSS
jgi:hypothetical protein